jgi:CRISPR-associated protein Cas1
MVAGLLYRDIGALAARHGLHHGIGALHTARDDQPALVSDLIEEFRAPLVESFVLALLNTKKLAAEHFATGTDGRPRLVPEGYARVIDSYEKWLNRPIKSPRNKHRVKWRRLVEEQAVAYKAHISGGPAYAPYAMDY